MRILLTACVGVFLLGVRADDREAEYARFKEICQRLYSNDKETRRHAAKQLGYIASELRSSGDLLPMLLDDADPEIRIEACKSLSLLGPLAKGTWFAVREKLRKEKDDEVRARLIGVLASM